LLSISALTANGSVRPAAQQQQQQQQFMMRLRLKMMLITQD
jgi:hypothetical protein